MNRMYCQFEVVTLFFYIYTYSPLLSNSGNELKCITAKSYLTKHINFRVDAEIEELVTHLNIFLVGIIGKNINIIV